MRGVTASRYLLALVKDIERHEVAMLAIPLQALTVTPQPCGGALALLHTRGRAAAATSAVGTITTTKSGEHNPTV